MELSVTETKKGRINLFADGEYQFTVSAFVWLRSPLFGKSEADEEALAALKSESVLHDAYEKALRLLARRAHGTAELRRKLRQTCPAEAADAAIARLEENGLLDDSAFALQLAEELSRRKAYAPERIRMELQKRGIDAETAKKAVNGIDINKKDGIIDIIRKAHLPDSPTKKDADRLVRRLLAAGYTMRDIREVVSFSYEDGDPGDE